MLALAELRERDDLPQEDHRVVLSGLTWADYKRLIEARGDRSAPRLTFREGLLEIMSPSRNHEEIKSLIGCLLEAYCLEREIDFSTYGSWTLEDERQARAVEPDECYVFGDVPEPERPDLAIEVVWTSGGLDKLDVYRKLGVREVWYWRRGRIQIHILDGDQYAPADTSAALPEIDLELLVSFMDRPTTAQAIRDYRAALR